MAITFGSPFMNYCETLPANEIGGKIPRQYMLRGSTITTRKRMIMRALRFAMEYCGHDLDAVMGTKSRLRPIVDIRSIAWAVYHAETNYSFREVANDFGWDRVTVFSAIKRANELRNYNRNFSDTYDSFYGAFMDAFQREKELGNIIQS